MTNIFAQENGGKKLGIDLKQEEAKREAQRIINRFESKQRKEREQNRKLPAHLRLHQLYGDG